jgi:hypothetical protein
VIHLLSTPQIPLRDSSYDIQDVTHTCLCSSSQGLTIASSPHPDIPPPSLDTWHREVLYSRILQTSDRQLSRKKHSTTT